MAFGFPKARPRVLDKGDAVRAKDANWRKVCKAVTVRDKACRVCAGRGNHHHHIVYRSHGGKDIESNVILTCLECHKLIHAKVVLVKFSDANPAKTITFTRNTQWDKAVPA